MGDLAIDLFMEEIVRYPISIIDRIAIVICFRCRAIDIDCNDLASILGNKFPRFLAAAYGRAEEGFGGLDLIREGFAVRLDFCILSLCRAHSFLDISITRFYVRCAVICRIRRNRIAVRFVVTLDSTFIGGLASLDIILRRHNRFLCRFVCALLRIIVFASGVVR